MDTLLLGKDCRAYNKGSGDYPPTPSDKNLKIRSRNEIKESKLFHTPGNLQTGLWSTDSVQEIHKLM